MPKVHAFSKPKFYKMQCHVLYDEYLQVQHDHGVFKQKKRLQPTKKLDCPAKILVKEVTKFPEYYVIIIWSYYPVLLL